MRVQTGSTCSKCNKGTLEEDDGIIYCTKCDAEIEIKQEEEEDWEADEE